MVAFRTDSGPLPPNVGDQDPHGAFADVIYLQRSELASVLVNPIGSQPVGLRSGAINKTTLWVQAEGAGPLLGRYLPDGRQFASGTHRKGGDTVVAPVGSVQELARGRHLNLGAGVALLIPVRQCGDGLKGTQGAISCVQVVPAYATALLVGEVENIHVGVETEVARPRSWGLV